jgi:hypothetical protein
MNFNDIPLGSIVKHNNGHIYVKVHSCEKYPNAIDLYTHEGEFYQVTYTTFSPEDQDDVVPISKLPKEMQRPAIEELFSSEFGKYDV